MYILRSILFVFSIGLGCCLRTHAQSPGFENETQAEAGSIMQALGANMSALECFDMSVTEETSHVSPEDDSGIDFVHRWRYVCNFREGVHLVIASHRRHRFSLTADTEKRERFFRGVFVDKSKLEAWLLVADSPGQIDLRSKDADSFDRWALQASGFPEPRLIGLAPYPHGFGAQISLEEVFRNSFAPPFRVSASGTGPKDRMEIVRIKDMGNEAPSLAWRYLMDMERLVPLQLAFDFVRKDGEVARKATEKLTWIDHDGLMVPQEIHGVRHLHSRRDAKQTILEHYDVVFTWHSVNNLDALPKVDKTILSSTRELMRLLKAADDVPDR